MVLISSMPPEESVEQRYTVGQLAKILGCSLRSLYRWEEAGVIPQAARIDRGEVSAGFYTASRGQEIRRILKPRLLFDSLLAMAPPVIPDSHASEPGYHRPDSEPEEIIDFDAPTGLRPTSRFPEHLRRVLDEIPPECEMALLRAAHF